jgi:single-strand DNA-binding protein
MSASYQSITLVGNLGRDPELQYTAEGKELCHFSLATNEKWTGKDGTENSQATWFNVSVFGKDALNCSKYLVKGSQVLVEGKMHPDKNGTPRIWDGTDGKPHASYDITATSRVVFLDAADPAKRNQVEADPEFG